MSRHVCICLLNWLLLLVIAFEKEGGGERERDEFITTLFWVARVQVATKLD